ncbi:MAG: hypothetical protein IGS48_11355 [Oscillatoriales cyanobacterium C42_A2020_001]|nr:hypothetical protein [Leptolyngbyaceae cyanobacterium C42_A2020_001]
MLSSKWVNSIWLTSPHRTHAILLLGVMLLVGCGSLSGSEPQKPSPTVQTTPIEVLLKLPKQASTVYLKGKVGDRVPLLGGTVYKLQDSTGEIWVLTQQPPPNTGEEVVVKGTLRYQSISINNQELGSVYVQQE